MWSAKRLRDDRRNNSTYAARVLAGESREVSGDGLGYLIIRSSGRTHLYIYIRRKSRNQN